MDMAQFQIDLAALINRHSLENGSDTPDFMIAEHLVGCLETYNKTVKLREKWYGREIHIKSDATPTTEPPPILC